MEQKGWIKAEWGQSENNRRARFYELTKDGRKQLATEAKDWDRLCVAISAIMQST